MMLFPYEYQEALLVKRYKRFLADVTFPNGDMVTVHCPNTGAMTGCAEPGSRIWLQKVSNPKAKYAWRWCFVETTKGLANIYSAGANSLFVEAFDAGRLPMFNGYSSIQREVAFANGASRADALLFGHPRRRDCLVEIKSVTLCGEEGIGYFPDARSDRALKHIHHLQQVIEQGEREAALIFIVQHAGIERVMPARHVDPRYADALEAARESGLQIVTLKAELDAGRYRIN